MNWDLQAEDLNWKQGAGNDIDSHTVMKGKHSLAYSAKKFRLAMEWSNIGQHFPLWVPQLYSTALYKHA